MHIINTLCYVNNGYRLDFIPQMSKVGLISIRNETGLADLTLDENDEQHDPFAVSFSHSL